MVSDRYPVPHILDFASGFSKIDHIKAYHQTPVATEDILKTAVSTLFELYKSTSMPFDLKKVAQTFQRRIDEVIPFVYAYVIDIVVANTNINGHNQHFH